MYRFIDGVAYEGKPSDSRWHVTVHDLADHTEVVLRRAMDWVDAGPVDCSIPVPEPTAAELEEKRQKARRRTVQRARSKIRRLCKAQALGTLLTLTYRANQTDLSLAKRHLSLFLKRCNMLWSRHGLGAWQYVAAFEPQRRGAWHVHLAVRDIPAVLPIRGVKVKSFNALRAIWRSITGVAAGNIDVSTRGRSGAKSGPARIASYLAKYLAKAFDALPGEVRCFQASQADLKPPALCSFAGLTFVEALQLAHAALRGDMTCCRLLPFGDGAFLSSRIVSAPDG